MKKSIFLPLGALILAAGILLALNLGLGGIAEKNAQADYLELMQTILPGSTEFTPQPVSGEDEIIHAVYKAENGFVIETVTYGYAGEITMLIGVSDSGSVTGLVAVDLSETSSLGAQILTNHEFLSQFLNISEPAAIATGGADAFSGATGESSESDAEISVDAISGATVTSKAVVRCVNAAIAYVTGADISSGATSWGG